MTNKGKIAQSVTKSWDIKYTRLSACQVNTHAQQGISFFHHFWNLYCLGCCLIKTWILKSCSIMASSWGCTLPLKYQNSTSTFASNAESVQCILMKVEPNDSHLIPFFMLIPSQTELLTNNDFCAMTSS